MKNVKILVIDEKSPYLDQVIKLGDENSKTLSFTNYSIFMQCAEKKQIIIAINCDHDLLGYLMYRVAVKDNRVTIMHLCINEKFRGQKIAKQLFEALKNLTKDDYSKIKLKCRRDYKIDKMWLNFGFIAKNEEKAKTKGQINTVWVYEYEQPPILALLNQKKEESKIFGIIDYQIFSELFDNPENQILSADWLELDIELCVNEDFYNQVNNIEDKNIRNKKREFIENFHIIKENLDNQELLKEFFKNQSISLKQFEFNNLLTAINLKKSDKCFITINQELLKIKEAIFDMFELLIKSPDDLVNEIDNISNVTYQPVRLAGINNIEKKKLSLDFDIESLELFINQELKEDQQEFISKIRYFLTNSAKFECYLIESFDDHKYLALIVYQRNQEYELEIPVLRINNSNIFVSTLAKHIIFESICISYQENRYFTKITDSFLSEVIKESIKEDSEFITIQMENKKTGYLKANIKITDSTLNVAKKIMEITSNLGENYQFYSKIAQSLINSQQEFKNFIVVEKTLFPVKFTDVEIVNFIIPIKPYWCQNLFDYKLANTSFFGASEPQLMLNTEAVYYKSKQAPKQLKTGVKGRILWYVSGQKEYQEVSRIRACSYLDEVVIGKAKDLYFQFRNLGIYKESDVLELTRDQKIMTINLNEQLNPNKEIMAIKFSHTELFDYPIELNQIQEILMKKVTMQSTLFINNEQFAIIYKLGTQKIE